MSITSNITRAEICAVAIADAFRDSGEILASPIGLLPSIGVRLAKICFEKELLMTDGIASFVDFSEEDTPASEQEKVIEGWIPYRAIFDLVLSGKRHVMMGATQIDRYGNQNISLIGEYKQPKSQLLGVRGAPSNTICHKTSYWVPQHTRKSFVDQVDMVCGIGHDRSAQLSPANTRFHHLHRVVTNLAVLDFDTPDKRMRLCSIHPGVSIEEVIENTGFELSIPNNVNKSRSPSLKELQILREVVDPNTLREREVAS
ncbi:MAG: CoA-transferase [Pseudomonadales bacterium]|nr:CoA-transferase [Pseudomonadales bacterium]